jgi:biofilm protein TabA
MAIIGNIHEVTRQAAGTDALGKGLSFLADVLNGKRPDITERARQLKDGENFEVLIEGKDVFANFQAYKSRARKDGFFEAHKEYTDIQCLLEGEELIETCMLADHGSSPVYDANANFFFPLAEKPGTRFHMKPGLTAVLFPADAHAPCLRSTEDGVLVRKVVVKVKHGGRTSA